jgi:hypothetical protein
MTMFKIGIAAMALLSVVGLATADAATKKKVHQAAPAPVMAAPAYAYPAPTRGPVWAAPGECYTDEGYGRYWPCGAGKSN